MVGLRASIFSRLFSPQRLPLAPASGNLLSLFGLLQAFRCLWYRELYWLLPQWSMVPILVKVLVRYYSCLNNIVLPGILLSDGF